MKKSDSELVLAARKGDQAAIGHIYDRYADRLFGFAFSILRDREEAADAVHDVILRSSQRLDQLRDPSRLRPWLFAIARNEVMTRTRQRAKRDDREVPDMAADLPDHDQGLVRDELQTLVWEAADALQPRDRELLELSMQGLEGEELAEALGVKTSHVHVLTSRMRDRMEKAVGSLLVARLGRDDCEKLEQLLSDWDGKFTIEVRSKVTRHIESCDTCTKRRAIACAPGSIAAALPAIIIPVSLRSRTLGSVESAYQGNPPDYTNPSSTNWTWDSNTGFPIKASIARSFSTLATIITGGVIAITATVIAIVIAVSSQGSGNNSQETSGVETASTVVEQPVTETGDSSQIMLNDELIIIPTDLILICNEGEYCAIAASLSEEPTGEVTLIGRMEDCSGFDIPSEHLIAKWGSSNWDESKGRLYLASADGEAAGDRVCKIEYEWDSSINNSSEKAFSIDFVIKDVDQPEQMPPESQPDPTPEQPEPTPEQPDPAPEQPNPTPIPEEQPNFVVGTTQLAFGSQYNAREITLTNTGETSVEWTMGSNTNQYDPTIYGGTLSPNSSTSIKIVFARSNLTEGDYNGVLSVSGDGEEYLVDLTGSVEVAPGIDFFYANPSAIVAVGNGCSTNQVSVSAAITDDVDLAKVEVVWSKDGVNTEITPLELLQGIWVGSLNNLESGVVPIANFMLRAVDIRGNESTVTTEITVRPCPSNNAGN